MMQICSYILLKRKTELDMDTDYISAYGHRSLQVFENFRFSRQIKAKKLETSHCCFCRKLLIFLQFLQSAITEMASVCPEVGPQLVKKCPFAKNVTEYRTDRTDGM